MIHNFTISFFEGGANIHFMSTRGPDSIDSIPDEIRGYVDYIVQYLESYKPPHQAIADQIVADFVATATTEELLARKELFDEWKPGEHYRAGEYVRNKDRLFKVLEPHYAAQPPSTGLKHTYEIVELETILPWREQNSPEDMYIVGEKYIDEDGIVWESNCDNNFNNAKDYPSGWRRLGTLEEYGAREEKLSGS